MTKERTVAFVVVRLTSSRFPAKQLRSIGNRSLLKWITDQLAKCRWVDEIVLATVAEAENRPLQNFAEKEGVSCYWYEGEVDHVTTRLRMAAEAYHADVCILISGDCPLIYAPAIDQLVRALKENQEADVVRILPNRQNHPSTLQGVVIGRKKAWQLADDLADRPELKEHQFPVIGLRPELFKPIDLRLADDLYMPPHRLSVDTIADLDFLNTVHNALNQNNRPFELPEVVRILIEQPQLKQINAHVHQRRLVEDIRKVLFIVDAGGHYGYGHLMRSVELAWQITERLGWPCHFMVDDQEATNILTSSGFMARGGAFERPSREPNHGTYESLRMLLDSYHLAIIDIFDQRGPEPGWRNHFKTGIPCVVMENLKPWAFEADLIVLPNIIEKNRSIDTIIGHNQDDGTSSTKRARIIGGKHYIILRREIAQIASDLPDKQIDLLVYLQDRKKRAYFDKLSQDLHFRIKIIDAFDVDFARVLAKSKVFISAFGISFYESLALKTIPVCWPDTKAHHMDAEIFYRKLNMERLIIESLDDIKDVILPLFDLKADDLAEIKDGTAAIVAEIAAMVKAQYADRETL